MHEVNYAIDQITDKYHGVIKYAIVLMNFFFDLKFELRIRLYIRKQKFGTVSSLFSSFQNSPPLFQKLKKNTWIL